MNDSDESREDHDERIERLLVDLIDAAESGDHELIEEFFRLHPQDEEELREHLAALSSMELLEGGAGLAPPFHGFDDYRLLKPLGRGGMGEVWLAEQTSLRRVVAVKFIRAGLGATERARERFRREARAMAALDHPNVARVWDSGTHENGLDWIAMEYVPGHGLDEILGSIRRDPSSFDSKRIVQWCIQIAHALQSAHDAGVIHRDVKPSNLRIRPDGRAVVIDFGLSRHLDERSLSASGDFIGSPHYAAPEQLSRDRGEIGPATDVYSLGLTLYEALTGLRPFEGESTDEVFRRILQTDPPSPRSLSTRVSRDLETVLLMALRKEPERRYPSASALARDLSACLDGAPIAARRESSIRRAARWSRRHPMTTAAAAFLVFTAATTAGVLWKLPEIRRLRSEERRWSIEDALDEGYTRQAAGLLEEGLAHFERALALDADDRDAVFGHALVLLELRRNEALHAWLDQRERRVPGDRTTALVRRMAMNIEGRRGGPKVAPPFDAAESFFMGHISLAAGYHEQALEFLRSANLIVSDSRPPYVFDLIQAEVSTGDHEGARRDLAAARVRWPTHPVADFIEAGLVSEDEPEQAVALLESFLEAVPGSPSALGNLGRARFRSGDVEGAVGDFERLLRLRPDDTHNRCDFAEILSRTGQVDEALTHYAAVLEEDEEHVKAWLGLGRCHLISRTDPRSSLAPLRRAMELAPANTETIRLSRLAARWTASWQDLLAWARIRLTIDPTDAVAARDMLRACCELGKPADAVSPLQDTHPTLSERAERWQALAQDGAWREAPNPRDRLAMIRILLARGEADRGRPDIDEVLDPGESERHELSCLVESARWHGSRRSWSDALDSLDDVLEILEVSTADERWFEEPWLHERPDFAALMTESGRATLPRPLRLRAERVAERAAALVTTVRGG